MRYLLDRDHTQLESRHRLEGHALGVISVDIDLRGETAVSSSIDSVIHVWDINGGKLNRSIATASSTAAQREGWGVFVCRVSYWMLTVA